MRKFLAEVEGKVFDFSTDYKEELQEYFCQKVTKGSLKKHVILLTKRLF